MQPLYTAHATAHGGRDGLVKSDDGVLEFKLAVPTGMGGPGGRATNPEQLFAAGYAACFTGAFKLVAGKQGVKTDDLAITAHVSIGKDETSFGLAVELVGVLPSVPKEKLQELMDAAHQVCPYSKATRGNIPVTVRAG